MRTSVLVDDMEHCVVCGSDKVQIHHVLMGTACRKLADEDGYIIPLCLNHHTGQDGIHKHRDFSLRWKMVAQRHFEQTHSRQEFIERYGKSYL